MLPGSRVRLLGQQEVDQIVVVVAAQEMDGNPKFLLEADQPPQNAEAGGATIDIVTDHDQLAGQACACAPRDLGPEQRQQRCQGARGGRARRRWRTAWFRGRRLRRGLPARTKGAQGHGVLGPRVGKVDWRATSCAAASRSRLMRPFATEPRPSRQIRRLRPQRQLTSGRRHATLPIPGHMTGGERYGWRNPGSPPARRCATRPAPTGASARCSRRSACACHRQFRHAGKQALDTRHVRLELVAPAQGVSRSEHCAVPSTAIRTRGPGSANCARARISRGGTGFPLPPSHGDRIETRPRRTRPRSPAHNRRARPRRASAGRILPGPAGAAPAAA